MVHSVERARCAISGADDLELIFNFPDFPVFMGCSDQPGELDLLHDMSWSISRSSGLIQLTTLLPLDVLYPEAHGAGAVGKLWDTHHRSFAQFISRWSPQSIFEIGGSHGLLERSYRQFGYSSWTILEPNPSPVDGCHARFIKGFFDAEFFYDQRFDAVVHSHVFEHMYEPDSFMRHLSGFIDLGKRLFFSIPNMQVMLERKYTNCINFEHTVFLTETYVDHLLSKHGFRLDSKEYFLEDHSIFYAATRVPAVEIVPLPPSLYHMNKRLYNEYIGYHRDLVIGLNDKILTAEGPVYLFGAHVFSQYLLAFGLNSDRIVGLLDNDVNKQGKRLYGTGLMVYSPAVLRDCSGAAVILKAGVYNQEIKEDILLNISSSVEFL